MKIEPFDRLRVRKRGDTKFTDAIVATKVKKRMLPPENGKPAFTYKLGNRSQKNKFMKKFYRAPEDEEDNNEE